MIAIGFFSYWAGEGEEPDLYGHFSTMVNTDTENREEIMEMFLTKFSDAKEAIATRGYDDELYERDEFFWTLADYDIYLDKIYLVLKASEEPVVFSAETIGLKPTEIMRVRPLLPSSEKSGIRVLEGIGDEPFFNFEGARFDALVIG